MTASPFERAVSPFLRAGLVAAAAAWACGGGAPSESPGAPAAAAVTLAVLNGKVWTGDPQRPWAEAVAVSGDTIAAVGSAAEIRSRLTQSAGATIIDARGGLVTPGFIDSHVHFITGGFRLASVQLRDAATRDEFVSRIRAYAATAPAGAWITGGDWDHSLWGGELPRRDWIDAVTPNHPVWVNRLDGHMALANSAALRAAGVSKATRDVDGGEIVRDRSGEPAGVLKDNAMALVARAVPPPGPEQTDRALRAAMRYVAEQGVTSVHDMGTWADVDAFARARRAEALTVRIYAAVPLETWERLRDAVAARDYGGEDGRGDGWLRVGALKGFVDGSLGSHTAAFHEPFTDAAGDRGLFVTSEQDLYGRISGADKAGLHVIVHAIGDRANTTLLDIFQRVSQENGPRDRRFRVEHAQHLSRSDIPRFGALGVIASMQPYHAIDDGRWAEKVIGPERIKTTYAFRALLDARATLAFGSDWFVAPPTPLEGVYAAVTRRTLDDRHPGGWVADQKITVDEALRAYTTAAAYASFEERRTGALTPGDAADIVVVDRDLFAIPPEQIRSAHIAATVAGGTVVFERGATRDAAGR
jgi:predicted amidohydrolase YtcJ